MKECPSCKKCYPDEINHCQLDGASTYYSIPGEPLLEGKYKLEKRLGQGGMGVVYLARHVYLKTLHAIKVILPDLVGNDPQLVTRFHQEARAAAAIRHQNVISVTDFGVVNRKMPFLVMEYVEGESLHELLSREKRISADKAVELMCGICAGVAAAHRLGIVHRDLKPLNIMICKDAPSLPEAVKILDFGLAKIKSGELLGSFIQAQTTGLMGSPYYMAPEQWADEEPNPQSDVYSLGIILYQMIAGDVPFKGNSIPAIMKKHLSDPPPPFASKGISAPTALEKAIFHALEKDRQKRTQSVEEFLNEIKRAVGYQSFAPATTATLQPTSLYLLSNSPGAQVFVDNVPVGQTKLDGSLFIEGVQSGSHKIRVVHKDFQDWEEVVVCDGNPKQLVASLTEIESKPIEKPSLPLHMVPSAPPNTEAEKPATISAEKVIQKSAGISPETKKPFSKSLILSIAGILLLLSLIVVVGVLLYRLTTQNENKEIATTAEKVAPEPEKQAFKPEMIKIPGGTFKMGRNDGNIREKPEFLVTVRDFYLEKTEVTNAEYEQFVKDTGHPAPPHWVGGRLLDSEKMMPVVFVDMNDIQEFVKWRSKRDGVQYRLPTEEEWEYAARNGADDNLYPWGDKWENDKAAVEVYKLMPVGSFPKGANKWGVLDLIGNVWEWTSSKIKPYPGANIVFDKPNNFVIRGGSFNSKSTGDKAITSTTRGDVEPTRKDGLLGFRLAHD